jgi:hypothetical protein
VFPKGAEWFIYTATIVVTAVGEVTSPVATKDHSGNGWMTSLACGYCHSYILHHCEVTHK